MEQNKLRIKVGDFEFEAEGPAEIVQAQLAAFKELLASPQAQLKPTQLPARHPGDSRRRPSTRQQG